MIKFKGKLLTRSFSLYFDSETLFSFSPSLILFRLVSAPVVLIRVEKRETWAKFPSEIGPQRKLFSWTLGDLRKYYCGHGMLFSTGIRLVIDISYAIYISFKSLKSGWLNHNYTFRILKVPYFTTTVSQDDFDRTLHQTIKIYRPAQFMAIDAHGPTAIKTKGFSLTSQIKLKSLYGSDQSRKYIGMGCYAYEDWHRYPYINQIASPESKYAQLDTTSELTCLRRWSIKIFNELIITRVF